MKKLIKYLLAGQILFSCTNSKSKTETPTTDTKNTNTKDTSNKMGENEIDKLVQQASNSGSSDDLTKLWKATLELKQWHFITKYQDNIQDSKPFVGVIDNQPWVFVFTDRQKAQSYCLNPQNPGFTDKEGNVMIVSMDTDKAIDYLMKLEKSGVFGVRLNEGNGWFSPLRNLPAIIKHVNTQ